MGSTVCDVSDIVDLVKDGKIIGIIDGGSEIGPRALGNRSIICDPSRKDMKDILDNVQDYIGTRATFTYFERTKAGSYRHPLFKTIRDYE